MNNSCCQHMNTSFVRYKILHYLDMNTSLYRFAVVVSNLGKCRFQTIAVPNPGCHKTSAVPLVVTGPLQLVFTYDEWF